MTFAKWKSRASRFLELGLVEGTAHTKAHIRDRLFPPRILLHWLPLSGFRAVAVPDGVHAGTIWGAGGGSHSDIEPANATGIASAEKAVFDSRIAAGAAYHFLLSDSRLAARLYTVSGMTRSFQHVPLTVRDVMVVDARVVPEFRGRGYYNVLLSETARVLEAAGFERLYIDTSERNVASISTFRRLGFQSVVGYRRRGREYRFDVEAL